VSLITKYRPTLWKNVVGQPGAVAALRTAIEHESARAFVLSGNSGLGKTTLARIAAKKVGCLPANLMEIDGATYTGIEAMRNVAQDLQYKPFTDNQVRAVIVDEAHALSRQAWDSLLKVVEEPPPDVYWFFCTTQPHKVPDTILTRCTHIQLRDIPRPELEQLVLDVAAREKIKLRQGVLALVVREARGSARQALANLGMCRDADRAAAEAILETAQESDTVLMLCKLLVDGGTWEQAMGLAKALADQNPEGVRIVVFNYLATAAQHAKNEKGIVYLLQRMEAFARSYGTADGRGQLVRSIGQCYFG
jgi:DNA polymerase III gamma/tau subunit